ncbi:MAG: sigma-70 family RNA polymerase sigma factor [Candidatus Gastranaerophilaceae bacterium]
MELAQEHLDLIKRIIRADRKFQNNEDLFDDFFNETCKRSLSILETIDDSDALEAYLKKVVSTSIIVVLKNMGRIRRSNQTYVSNNDILENNPIETKDETIDYKNVNVNYDFINIQTNPEEIVVKKELLQSVYDTIIITHSQNIDKQFLQLYEMRYVEGKKQSEIAQELNISQSLVSKRLFELMNEVKKAINP